MAMYKSDGLYPSESPDDNSAKDNKPKGKKNKKQNGGANKKRNTVLNILLVVAILVFGFSLYQIISINSDYKVARDEYSGLSAEFVTPGSGEDGAGGYKKINYSGLQSTNSDFVGWIDIPGTPVSFPMVWYSNNDYYLYQTFYKTYAVSGSIFLDYRINKDFTSYNTVIHGHRMNDNSMFAPLANFMDKSYWEDDRKEVHIYTPDGIMIYDIFAAFKLDLADETTFYRFSFDSASDYQDYLQEMKTYSLYDTGVSVASGNNMLTLSTCVFGNENMRQIVLAIYRETVPNPQ